MRYLALLFVFLSFSALTSEGWAQTQWEMNDLACADLEKADKKLNAIYKRLISQNGDNPQARSDLKKAQQAWLKFVEFHMKTVFPLKDGENPRVLYGSIYPYEFATEKTFLFTQRIKQLEGLLNDPVK